MSQNCRIWETFHLPHAPAESNFSSDPGAHRAELLLLVSRTQRAMTAPALTAAQEGVRYQYRFFWRMALPMLYLDTPQKVVMEHRGVDAVDDVVVYWADPGVADGGGFVRVDFHQIKFHVNQGNCVSSGDLIDPD